MKDIRIKKNTEVTAMAQCVHDRGTTNSVERSASGRPGATICKDLAEVSSPS
jgi:hypothetical protein